MDLYTVFWFILYFLPTIVALSTGSPLTVWVFAINGLLGWTYIGWIIAMVMACISLPIKGRKGTISES